MHLTSPLHAGEPLGPETIVTTRHPEPAKKRQTRSYATELLGLQSRVDAALRMLPSVKVDKGSTEIMAAVIAVLQGQSG
jgi:hypothetical protein